MSDAVLMSERFNAGGGYVTVSLFATATGPRLHLGVGQDRPARHANVPVTPALSLGLRRALLQAAIETEALENEACRDA